MSQPPEEETTTPTVEVPDVSAPENTPAQEQADPVLDVEQEDQVDVDLTDREKKPETTPPPAPSPEEQQAASENDEPIVSDPAPISPRTAIRRTALFTLRASAGFLTRAAVLCSTILIQMEI